MWIAKQACLAPLPEGWAELEDPAGQAYYYHAATDRSTRAHPLDATFQVLLKMERARLGKWSFSRANFLYGRVRRPPGGPGRGPGCPTGPPLPAKNSPAPIRAVRSPGEAAAAS